MVTYYQRQAAIFLIFLGVGNQNNLVLLSVFSDLPWSVCAFYNKLGHRIYYEVKLFNKCLLTSVNKSVHSWIMHMTSYIPVSCLVDVSQSREKLHTIMLTVVADKDRSLDWTYGARFQCRLGEDYWYVNIVANVFHTISGDCSN